MFSRFLGTLRQEFKGYNGAGLAKDLMAGLTVTAVALPLALAFGVSSGADAASGLITAIVAGIVISAFSGAYYQISGPTGAMAAILMSLVARYQMQGVFLATLLAGGILLAAGLLKLGKLVSWIPAPVITGFTSGIAIIIAMGQLDNFFGVASQGETAITKLLSYGRLGFVPNLQAVGVGLFVVLFMVFFPKKWGKVVPSSLLGIILATAVTAALGLDVAVVGEIPKTLMPEQRLNLSAVSLSQLQGVLAPAVSIALLGMIESLLCGVSAGRMTGSRLDADQELVAQGIGNLLLPFFGGIPATAAIARTSVAVRSGAKTRLTGIFHAVGLLLAMFVLGPVMSEIPLSGLAGVLMVTAWRMNEWEAIRYMFTRKFRGAILKFFVTMILTVALDLTMAIAVGVTVGLVLFIRKSAGIEIAVENVDPARAGREDVQAAPDWAVVYVTGPMFFMNADAVRQRLEQLQDRELIVLSLRGVPLADVTSVSMLLELHEQLQKQERKMIFTSVQPSVMKVFEQAGLKEAAGQERFYFSADQALRELL